MKSFYQIKSEDYLRIIRNNKIIINAIRARWLSLTSIDIIERFTKCSS